MERKLPGNFFFRKSWYTSRGCFRFWKFWRMLFHSLLLEVAENSNPTFWLNGKRPVFLGFAESVKM